MSHEIPTDKEIPLPVPEREIIQRRLAVYRYPNLVTPEMWQAYQATLKEQDSPSPQKLDIDA